MTTSHPTKKTEPVGPLDLWTFNWPVMDVFMNGSSSIDLDSLNLKNFEDAHEFLKSYGYDPEDPKYQRKIHSVLIEAIHFIEKKLMPAEWKNGLRPPQDVLMCTDARQLLLWASRKIVCPVENKIWSCAILRLMHTIAHIEGVHSAADLDIARQQIFTRFEEALFRDAQDHLWFGDKTHCVQLEHVEWKYFKSRESIILKLLHKPGNVAETIYDPVGIRIITKHRRDVMLAVNFLRRFYLVTFPNAIPSRMRNNLIDYEEFRKTLEKEKRNLAQKLISEEEFLRRLDDVPLPSSRISAPKNNPHSSSSYRSVQLTCRQLIRYPDPLLSWQTKLLNDSTCDQVSPRAKHRIEELLQYVNNWHGCESSHEISVFFPFEVQILDAASHRMIASGDASHDVYKTSQIRTARRRILGKILNQSSAKCQDAR